MFNHMIRMQRAQKEVQASSSLQQQVPTATAPVSGPADTKIPPGMVNPAIFATPKFCIRLRNYVAAIVKLIHDGAVKIDVAAPAMLAPAIADTILFKSVGGFDDITRTFACSYTAQFQLAALEIVDLMEKWQDKPDFKINPLEASYINARQEHQQGTSLDQPTHDFMRGAILKYMFPTRGTAKSGKPFYWHSIIKKENSETSILPAQGADLNEFGMKQNTKTFLAIVFVPCVHVPPTQLYVALLNAQCGDSTIIEKVSSFELYQLDYYHQRAQPDKPEKEFFRLKLMPTHLQTVYAQLNPHNTFHEPQPWHYFLYPQMIEGFPFSALWDITELLIQQLAITGNVAELQLFHRDIKKLLLQALKDKSNPASAFTDFQKLIVDMKAVGSDANNKVITQSGAFNKAIKQMFPTYYPPSPTKTVSTPATTITNVQPSAFPLELLMTEKERQDLAKQQVKNKEREDKKELKRKQREEEIEREVQKRLEQMSQAMASSTAAAAQEEEKQPLVQDTQSEQELQEEEEEEGAAANYAEYDNTQYEKDMQKALAISKQDSKKQQSTPHPKAAATKIILNDSDLPFIESSDKEDEEEEELRKAMEIIARSEQKKKKQQQQQQSQATSKPFTTLGITEQEHAQFEEEYEKEQRRKKIAAMEEEVKKIKEQEAQAKKQTGRKRLVKDADAHQEDVANKRQRKK